MTIHNNIRALMGKRKHGEQTGDVIRVIEILRKKIF